MKTAYSKLTLLIFVLALTVMLFAPMRSGVEDSLTALVSEVMLEPGETVGLSYELLAESAQTVAWRSENPYVAAVDQRGVITAVAPGKTKIRLEASGGAADVVRVEVTGVPVTVFSLNTHELDMNKGDVSGLSYSFNNGATAQHVTWQSDNEEVVRVDAAGRLSAVGSGETRVTATTASGLFDTALVRVHVRAESVKIKPDGLTVGVGSVFGLDVSYLPEDATDAVVGWSSSAPQVLAVDASGRARAVSAGTATVTVTTRDGIKSSAVINVEPAAKGFQLSAGESTLERGEVCALEARFTTADGETDPNIRHHVEWSSSDERVAAVKDGVVTAVASGKATITARADGFEAECSVHVRTSIREITLNVTEQTLYREQTNVPFHIRATVLPEDADPEKLTFTSDNPLVANVAEDGLVTMTGGYGTAVITVESKSGAKAFCTVSVVVPAAETDEAEKAEN